MLAFWDVLDQTTCWNFCAFDGSFYPAKSVVACYCLWSNWNSGNAIKNINGYFVTVCEIIWTGFILFPFLLCTCKVHGELDTRVGAPSYLSAVIRHFYPDVCFTLWVALISYDHYYGKLVFPSWSIIDVYFLFIFYFFLFLSIVGISKPWGWFAIW